MQEERYEHTHLHSAGSIPGYSGSHVGPVVLDKVERKVYTLQEWQDMQTPVASVEQKQVKPVKSVKDVL
jgi:hypothetical protein